MADQRASDATTLPPLDMREVGISTMTEVVAASVSAMIDSGELDYKDMATARLALEVAERIDADGLECGISLYSRLHSLLLDLQHVDRAPACPLAQQLVQVPGEVTKSE